jgi:hypothetical protein
MPGPLDGASVSDKATVGSYPPFTLRPEDFLTGWTQHAGPFVRTVEKLTGVNLPDVGTDAGWVSETNKFVYRSGYEWNPPPFSQQWWMRNTFGPLSDMTYWLFSEGPPALLDPRHLWNVGSEVVEEVTKGDPVVITDVLLPSGSSQRDRPDFAKVEHWFKEDPVGQLFSDSLLIAITAVGGAATLMGAKALVKAIGTTAVGSLIKKYGAKAVAGYFAARLIGKQVKKGTEGLEQEVAWFAAQYQDDDLVPTPAPPAPTSVADIPVEPPPPEYIYVPPSEADYAKYDEQLAAQKAQIDAQALEIAETKAQSTATADALLTDLTALQKQNAEWENYANSVLTGVGRGAGKELVSQGDGSSGGDRAGGGGPTVLDPLALILGQIEDWKKRRK